MMPHDAIAYSIRLAGRSRPASIAIDRELAIILTSDDVVLAGRWDFVNGTSWEAGAFELLPHTALDMAGAAVESTVSLFRSGRLPRSWLRGRAVYDVDL